MKGVPDRDQRPQRAYACPGSGFRVQGLELRVKVQGSGFRGLGSHLRVQGSGFKVQGSGCTIKGLEGLHAPDPNTNKV